MDASELQECPACGSRLKVRADAKRSWLIATCLAPQCLERLVLAVPGRISLPLLLQIVSVIVAAICWGAPGAGVSVLIALVGIPLLALNLLRLPLPVSWQYELLAFLASMRGTSATGKHVRPDDQEP